MLSLTRPLARGHSRSNGHCGVQPTVRVAIRNTDFLGTALGIAGQRRQAGQRHDSRSVAHIVFLRPAMAIAGDGGHNQGRIPLCQLLIAQAQTLHHAGGKVLHHNVGFLNQGGDNGKGLRLAQVEQGAFFALMPLVEIARAIETRLHAGRINRHTASEVGAHMRFNPNDLGSQVGQLQGAVGARPRPTEIDDAETRKGEAGVGG